jgi:hypothetical protein
VPIRKIAIRNLRCFEKVDLDLSRPDGSLAGFTVLAGRNGSGKTTLLKTFALGVFGPLLALNLEPGFGSWIRRATGKRKPSPGTIQADTDGTSLFGLEISPSGLKVGPIVDSNTLSEISRTLASRAAKNKGFNADTFQLIEAFIQRDLDKRKHVVVIAYGSNRRLLATGPEAQKLSEGNSEIGRVANLFREDVSLIESVNWLREEVYLRRLEGSRSHADLETTVLSLLDDGLLPDGTKVESVDSDGLWVRQNGVRLNLRELSDGYRTVAALVLDIVRHLHGAYGDLNIEKGTGRSKHVRVLNEAVVLIDEIEMHLHVSWQQRIGFWLKEHFSAVQFLVTTHSPFICQAADPGGLIRLPAPGENRSVERVSDELYFTVVNGSLDEAVLSELFGIDTPYSPQAEELREDVADLEAKLIGGRGTATDRKKLATLRKKLPSSMSSDVEIAVRSLGRK